MISVTTSSAPMRMNAFGVIAAGGPNCASTIDSLEPYGR